MLALTFAAGDLRFALPCADIVQVLPRVVLRALPEAPAGLVGLLPFRRRLVPVVDLCQRLLNRPCAGVHSTRLLIVRVTGSQRRIGLLAEDVLDLVQLGQLDQAMVHPGAPWLGPIDQGLKGKPQLLYLEHLMPDVLAALNTEQAA